MVVSVTIQEMNNKETHIKLCRHRTLCGLREACEKDVLMREYGSWWKVDCLKCTGELKRRYSKG